MPMSSWAMSTNERQRQFRARQKQIDGVEPLLKELRIVLADIHETDSHESRIEALTIIGAILTSSTHKLCTVDMEEFSEMDIDTQNIIVRCTEWCESARAVQSKNGE
jgi:hypothetical protein